ncbi:MAG: hypothetical protein QM778_14525 [Myxococcales bacterium]
MQWLHVLGASLLVIAGFGIPKPERACAQVGPRALPALFTTPRILRPKHTSGTILGAAGYGSREQFSGSDETRSTALGALAAAVNHRSGIAGELRLDGRLEVPPNGNEKLASVGEVRGFVRVSPGLYKNFDLRHGIGSVDSRR